MRLYSAVVTSLHCHRVVLNLMLRPLQAEWISYTCIKHCLYSGNFKKTAEFI